MSRDQVHALVGIPDSPSEVGKKHDADTNAEESFRFSGMAEYFYLFGESPIGTHTFLTEYTLTLRYNNQDRVVKCRVCKDSRVGLFGL